MYQPINLSTYQPINHAITKSMNGNQRSNITIGAEVKIVLKQHQRTGQLTEGIVERILTKSSNHPHGIKVRLETGEVGRVKEVIG